MFYSILGIYINVIVTSKINVDIINMECQMDQSNIGVFMGLLLCTAVEELFVIHNRLSNLTVV